MESILDKLESERIFEVKLSEDKKNLEFTEACDRCFGVDINRTEAIRLITELQWLVNEMKP